MGRFVLAAIIALGGSVANGEVPSASFEPVSQGWNAYKGNVSPQRVLASVRIGAGGGCSGTIIQKAGTAAWGITAWHCSNRVGTRFTIGNPDGSTANAWWVARDESLDLALFVTYSKDVLGVVPVCKDAVPDWSKPVEAIGYPNGSGPKWKRFKYVTTHGHSESGSNKYFRNRYLFQNLGPGTFAGGDSGGGVFYDGDHFIGVSTHGGPHAASLPQIQKFLSDHEKEFQRFNCTGFSGNINGRTPGWRPSPNIPILPGNPGDKDRTKAIERLQKQVDELKKAIADLKLKPGPAGAKGDTGPKGADGKDGKDGRGIKSIEADGGGNINVEYTDGTKKFVGKLLKGADGKSVGADKIQEILQAAVAKAIANAQFTVVFEKGDEASETERTVVVKIGGTLKIPPVSLRVRNVDVTGKQVGAPLFDVAPLGSPLKLRSRPPVKAKQ